jgi:hypothetical protein
LTTDRSATLAAGTVPDAAPEPLAALTVARLFWLALALAAVAAAHAASEARDLNADGSLYLLSAVSGDGFAFFEWARRTVQFLQQSFAYLGQVVGITDLLTLGRLLTVGMQFWPLILTAMCWFLLPVGEKGWILGPLVNIAVVIPMTSFMGIGEGIIASCLMWLLFFLVEFDAERWPRPLAAGALAVACFHSHEACAPFMLGVAWLAARHSARAAGARRAAFAGLALLALGAAADLVSLTLHRPGADGFAALGRGVNFFYGLGIGWLITVYPRVQGVHLPALAAVAVVLCLALTGLPRYWPEALRARALRRASQGTLLLFALIAVLFIVAPERVSICPSFMAARGWPVIDTTVMAAGIHLLRRRGWTPQRLAPPQVRAVLLGIIPMQLAIQTGVTLAWADYRDDLARLVASRQGPIPWEEAAAALDPRREPFRGAFVWAWSIQPLSVVLAPRGQVQAIVEPRPNVEYRPYRPDDPDTLPRCVPGLDWSRYLAAIGKSASPRPDCAR